MQPVLRELNVRLDEVEANVDFVAISTSLRPWLGSLLNWDVGGDGIGLARRFMEAAGNRPENLYGALLVRALAAFERFARLLVDDAANRMAARAKSFNEIKEQVRSRHTVLTGRLLGSVEEPRDYQTIDVKQLAENLASCTSGSTAFRLNASAFAAVVVNGSPPAIEKALSNLGIDSWWDAVGRAANLRSLLMTKGPRETGKMARKRLEELYKRRNQIAHAGDGDITVSETDLRAAIQFVRALSEALEREVSVRLA
jgi:hypothetical protein